METKNTTIGYLVGKETFSPGEGDNPNFFNFPQKFFSDRKEALDAFKKEKQNDYHYDSTGSYQRAYICSVMSDGSISEQLYEMEEN